MEQITMDTEKGQEIYKKYIAWLYKLVVEENNNFDLIIGPADSGTFMAEAAKIFYQTIKKVKPKIIILPIQRYEAGLGIDTGPHFDNSPLVDEIKKEIQELKKLENVLFVDDEIGVAYTAKEAIRLVLVAAPKETISNRVIYTILAENHGFEWRYDVPPVAIKYVAFANKKTGINGAIFEIITDDILNLFKEIDSTITKKKIASLFSAGLIKDIQNNKPTLSSGLLETIQNSLPQFDELKEDFNGQVKLFTDQAIKEYSDGSLKLRD